MPQPDDPLGFTLPTPEEKELEDMKRRVLEEFNSKNHKPVTAEDFRAMAKFCDSMAQAMLQVFMAFQEQVKTAALAFSKFAEVLEEDAKQKKEQSRTKVENVFESDDPTNPGPVVSKE